MKAAINFFRQALEIKKKCFGAEHPLSYPDGRRHAQRKQHDFAFWREKWYLFVPCIAQMRSRFHQMAQDTISED
jgi:hypothetical protein